MNHDRKGWSDGALFWFWSILIMVLISLWALNHTGWNW